jgi:hypothetical protein
MEFYAKLGFAVSNTHTPEGEAEPVWAWLQAGGAHLMVSRSRDGNEAAKQAVLLYLYATDLEAFRTELLTSGVETGAVEYPFWAPRGEFRVHDPDGFVFMTTHT